MTSDGGDVAEVSPWLCQGDLFSTAPVLHYPDLSVNFVAQLRRGPALLVSHDCALDKMNGRGLATIERLAFVSVRNVTSLDTQRQKMLRDKATELAPFEVQYIGNLDGIGEAYVALSDPYYVPAQYFGVEARVFPGLPEDEKRLAITAHDTRIGRLGTDSVELFREKWNAYWTRVVPE